MAVTGTDTPARQPAAIRLSLARLLQLASPALPVGAFSYSQGLEAAVEAGTVGDAASAGCWIADVLRFSVARFEVPAWRTLLAAWLADDMAAVEEANDLFLCTRESAELRAETVQMGYSLRRLLLELGGAGEDPAGAGRSRLERLQEPAFPTAFTFAVAAWRIPEADALTGYLWSWLENQVMAAIKAVPLGQTDGQRLLHRLAREIVIISECDAPPSLAAAGNYAHGLAIACSRHETQYSRLFRS